MSTQAPLFLIGSSSYLQVTRTSITSRTSSKFGQIGPRTAELAALKRLEKSPQTYNGRNLVNTLAPSIFKSIILILAGIEDMHESLDEFKFRPETDTNTSVICPCASEKMLYNVVTTVAPSFFDRIFFILAGNEDTHNISDEFEIRPDRTKDCGVSCYWASGKIPIGF